MTKVKDGRSRKTTSHRKAISEGLKKYHAENPSAPEPVKKRRSLASLRSAKLAERRKAAEPKKTSSVLQEIEDEGYQDAQEGAKCSHPYRGNEAEAYKRGYARGK